ncbi:MAG TPA: mechanosensitive ion channel family protein [Longimicrobiales bacterium]|nr:mechanosensitive ion channel family protein [Longimicrobiales bacterium]
MPFLDWTYLDNSVRSWLIAAGVALIVYAGTDVLRRLLIRQITALSTRTDNYADDLIADTLRRTKTYFLLFISLYAASRVLYLSDSLGTALRFVGVIVVVAQTAVWGTVVINTLVKRQMAQRVEEDAATATTINALGFVVRLAFYSILVLMGLDNLGFDVTALIAGLGIGGIAVALALQNVLGDLFASLSIVLDRPFVIGDFIIVDDLAGTVEYVGLKTTRVKSLSGEQLVFANSDLLGARVRNFKRMYERRIVFGLGVTYDTPRSKLEQIPRMIRDAVEGQENTRFDRAHFKEYGDFSLNFEVVYFVLVPEYNTYMDVQQSINFDIHRAFEAAGIEFAYPTQTIIMARA